jgi:hypothetical protein
MAKEKVWIDGNHMVFESSSKTFNEQVGAILEGQVFGPCQTSFCVRPYNETKCNSTQFPKGHLRDCDLNVFRDIPSSVRDYVESITQDEGIVLYHFYHRKKRRAVYGVSRKVSHGWVVTRGGHGTSTLVRAIVTGRGDKSRSVIAEAVPYVIA